MLRSCTESIAPAGVLDSSCCHFLHSGHSNHCAALGSRTLRHRPGTSTSCCLSLCSVSTAVTQSTIRGSQLACTLPLLTHPPAKTASQTLGHSTLPAASCKLAAAERLAVHAVG
eukprot:GHRQ01027285.1.p3 GENE.GHRQ01027285.1~~GHRQ01027285.1.p3  ORF type:complete len:114 (+),score=10.66 GHRQ01027285.1:254-595(+)